VLVDGFATATPTLQEALRRFAEGELAADDLHLLWLATITAPTVWDDARWEALSTRPRRARTRERDAQRASARAELAQLHAPV
jgi:hypothetical protein